MDSSGAVQRVLRKTVLGTVQELPTRKLAQRRLDFLLAHINSIAVSELCGICRTLARTHPEDAETFLRSGDTLTPRLSSRVPVQPHLARTKHLGFIVIPRAVKAAGEQVEKWLFTYSDLVALAVHRFLAGPACLRSVEGATVWARNFLAPFHRRTETRSVQSSPPRPLCGQAATRCAGPDQKSAF